MIRSERSERMKRDAADRREAVRAVACPLCKALVGERCVAFRALTEPGGPISKAHTERVIAWRAAGAPRLPVVWNEQKKVENQRDVARAEVEVLRLALVVIRDLLVFRDDKPPSTDAIVNARGCAERALGEVFGAEAKK